MPASRAHVTTPRLRCALTVLHWPTMHVGKRGACATVKLRTRMKKFSVDVRRQMVALGSRRPLHHTICH